METAEFLRSVGIIFVMFIVPLWLILHYRLAKQRITNKDTEEALKIAEESVTKVNELQQNAQQLMKRVKVLESILDDKVPEWRKSR